MVVILSTIALSYVLKKENKKMDEAEALGYMAEEGRKADVTSIEIHNGNTTAGRRLGGANSGATARFDT
jgi:uncharacterized protein YpmB